MENFRIKGIDGFFSCKIVRMFNRLQHFKNNGKIKLIASVPAGNYESHGVKACGNSNAFDQLSAELIKYIGMDDIKFIGSNPSFWRSKKV